MVSAGAWAAGAAQTLIHIPGTAGASKAGEAGAGKGTHVVLTGAAIQAGVCGRKGEGVITHVCLTPPHQPFLTWPFLAQQGTREDNRLNREGHILSEGASSVLSVASFPSLMCHLTHVPMWKGKGLAEPKVPFELPGTYC